MADLFVGRQRQLRASLDLLAAPGDGAVQDIVGVRGLGKSAFIERISDQAAQLKIPGQQVEVYGLDMQVHDLGVGFLPGDRGANASPDMLQEVFTRSQLLMGVIAKGHREFDRFRSLSVDLSRDAMTPAAAAGIRIGNRASFDTLQLTVQQSDAAVRQHLRALQSQLDDAFVKAWDKFSVRRRILITLDSFQLAAGNELGHWLIRMVLRLRNTLTVLARTPSNIPLWSREADLSPVELPFFGRDEITEYLGRRLGAEGPISAFAETTQEFTNGHPGGVKLVGDLIMNKGGPDLRPAELRRMLDNLPSEGDELWAGLVVEILKAVQGDNLLSALDAAAAAGVFDGSLLAELIDPEKPAEATAGEIIRQLSGLRMLQPVPAISGGPSDRYRLPEFIRQSAAFRVQTHAPGEWQRLQSVAEQYYFRRLEEWETEPYDSYGAWYRFEDPRWQECKREWLRHAGLAFNRGLTRNRDFITRARFTLVFLEAFWWWGVYLPCPFMRQMLDDWARVSAEWARIETAGPSPLERQEDPNRVLLTKLTELINDYPETHVKPSSAPWDKVRENLIQVRTLCGLNPAGGLTPVARRRASEEEQAEMTRTDAFITLFLAHSYRFREPADPIAERLYAAALTAFRAIDDEWTTEWVVFEQADLALERRDLPASAERLAEGAALARDLAARTFEWDQELLANLHRAWADVCWLSGRLGEAARHYGQAVAHAYWFHGEPNSVDGGPHGPDEYTQQFYFEMTLRAAERITEIADRPAELERFVSEMQREVPGGAPDMPTAGLAAATVTELRDRLFPAGPIGSAGADYTELRRLDTPFMDRWSNLYMDRQPPLIGLDDLTRASLD